MSRPKPKCCAKRTPLKPCPFCGSPGAVYKWTMSYYWTAKCTNDLCGAGWPNWFNTKGDAVKQWNTRKGA